MSEVAQVESAPACCNPEQAAAWDVADKEIVIGTRSIVMAGSVDATVRTLPSSAAAAAGRQPA